MRTRAEAAQLLEVLTTQSRDRYVPPGGSVRE
jgi:hypothetical protein